MAERVEEYMRRLRGLLDESEQPRWAIARLLARAEDELGEDIGEVWELAAVRGMTLATIKRRVWVARTWAEDDVARFPTLTFSHFESVTARWLEYEDGMDLLQRAAAEEATVDTLRAWVRELRQGNAPEEPDIPFPHFTQQLGDYLVSVLHHEAKLKPRRAMEVGALMVAALRRWGRERGEATA